MAYKMIHVGTGGFGTIWCRHFLPRSVADGLIEVVAAVDIDPDALVNAREGLGLPPERCYTDIRKAFDEHRADFCSIVVPPAFHESVVDLALDHDMDILSEKPIADSLEGSIRIANKVKAAGKKMGVTMSHRFDQDKSTLRELLRSGQYGPLDYIVSRFTCDCRKYASWGAYRHEMADALLIEGGVHHLDIIADFAGALCDTIYAQTWNPRWGEFKGDSQALVTMHFENNTRAVYEAAKTNAVSLNPWSGEYFRAECQGATLILNRREIEAFPYDATKANTFKMEGQGQNVPMAQRPKWTHFWLIEQFVNWLNGGEPMVTNVEDNLQSVALVFGAVQSSHTGLPVKVQELLANTRKAVEN